jgi:hypothetical protein
VPSSTAPEKPNATLPTDALSHLPPRYEISRDFSTLHQALHLWMLAHSPAGVGWPGSSDEKKEEGTKEKDAPHALPSVASAKEGSISQSVPLSTLNPQLSTPADASFSVLPSPFSSPGPISRSTRHAGTPSQSPARTISAPDYPPLIGDYSCFSTAVRFPVRPPGTARKTSEPFAQQNVNSPVRWYGSFPHISSRCHPPFGGQAPVACCVLRFEI